MNRHERYAVCCYDSELDEVERRIGWSYYSPEPFTSLNEAMEVAADELAGNEPDFIVFLEYRELPEWGPLP